MAPRHIADTLQRLRSEYLEMPRLSLTPGQVAQILNVDPPVPTRNLILITYVRDY